MKKAPLLRGEVEVDTGHFRDKRNGKGGPVVAGKVLVFGLLMRGGHVHTIPIPNIKAKTLVFTFESRMVPDRIWYTDNFAGHNVLGVSGKSFIVSH